MALPKRDLLPHMIDARAASGYTRPWALIAKSRNALDGFRSISHAQLANAINRSAWWLDSNISDTTFTYLGPNDVRYAILVIAAMKTKKRVRFIQW